jgi:pyruvate dehydrogenase E2 component (dihydrolipoamide acetyltransferase)
LSELRLPELGENIESADVSAVLVAVGDLVRRDQPVIEVETEKASLEVPAHCDGRVTELRVKVGDKVAVGEAILTVDESGACAEVAAAAPEPRPSASPPAPPPGTGQARAALEPAPLVRFPARSAPRVKPEIGVTAPAAPSVRALARELGVDVREVPGSGPGGRICRDDVKAHAKRLIQGREGGAARRDPVLPDFARWGEIARRPLSNLRRKTAENMALAWATIPQVTQFDRADITQLEAMRKRFNARPEAAGAKLTVTAIAVKLAAGALQRFPQFNASLDLAENAVVLKGYVHVGVAVDTERGLLVPVVRDVNHKRLVPLAEELRDLAERARSKKVKPEELQGATFTVTNLGGLGTTHFSPIVNWPEVAILGLGRAETVAVHEDGEFKPHLMLPLSLSYDHRLIDGADAARFLRWIAEALEQPLLLLLEDPGA